MVKKILLCAFILLAASGTALAGEALQPTHVGGNVWAIIGPLGDRTPENDGLNANQAFIVTGEGVILIDSGASKKGAERIEKAIASVTPLPVKWVINTGSQDHRWLGNGHFAEQGAEIIAFEDTVATQKRYAAEQMQALSKTLGERFAGTEPVHASRLLKSSPATLTLGGETLELVLTHAHFPGDAMVWLPEHKIAVSGDLVFVDRILGVLESSSVRNAWAAWQALERLEPLKIIPGHGQVCDLARARRETGDYYAFLVQVIGKAAQEMEPLDEVIERYADMPQFAHLEHYRSLHKTNMNRAYLEFEGL